MVLNITRLERLFEQNPYIWKNTLCETKILLKTLLGYCAIFAHFCLNQIALLSVCALSPQLGKVIVWMGVDSSVSSTAPSCSPAPYMVGFVKC